MNSLSNITFSIVITTLVACHPCSNKNMNFNWLQEKHNQNFTNDESSMNVDNIPEYALNHNNDLIPEDLILTDEDSPKEEKESRHKLKVLKGLENEEEKSESNSTEIEILSISKISKDCPHGKPKSESLYFNIEVIIKNLDLEKISDYKLLYNSDVKNLKFVTEILDTKSLNTDKPKSKILLKDYKLVGNTYGSAIFKNTIDSIINSKMTKFKLYFRYNTPKKSDNNKSEEGELRLDFLKKSEVLKVISVEIK